MSYLTGYTETSVEALLSETRPLDADPDLLPFERLAWRRFEVLTSLLKEKPGDVNRTVLMAGSSDQGCDILTYDPAGRVVGIAQCKNHRDPLSLTDVTAELLKIALHWYLNRGFSAERLSWELWAPSFSNQAITFLEGWPSTWTETVASSAFERTTRGYAAFRSLTWPDVRTFVLDDFSRALSVRRVDGYEITRRVRERPALLRQFFQTSMVLELEDARTLIEDSRNDLLDMTLKLLRDRNFRMLEEADVRHVVDLVQGVPRDRRFFLGHGYCFGLSREAHRSFDAKQLGEFTRCVLEAVHGPATLILEVASRKSFQATVTLRNVQPAPGAAFVYVAHRFLHNAVLAAHRRLTVPKVLLDKLGFTLNVQPPDESSLDALARDVWEELRRGIPLLSPTDPAFEVRLAIIESILANSPTPDIFAANVRRDCEVHLETLLRLHRELLDLIPERLIILSDIAGTNLDDEEVLTRWIDASQAMSPPGGIREAP